MENSSNILSNELYRNKIINGTLLSGATQNILKEKIKLLNSIISERNLPIPKLKIILVGDRPDSRVYVENKLKLCETIGIEGELKKFESDIEENKVLEEIEESNNDSKIHGIIVQLPLPAHLEKTKILSKVNLNKDVDGLNPMNQGKVLQMNISECLLPPTAMGVLEMLRLSIEYNNNIDDYLNCYLKTHCFSDEPVNLSGLDVTVLGRGLTAGLPLSILMQKCNATVTLCHSKTNDACSKSFKSDILISAVGIKDLVNRDYVRDDSIIIDVGINVTFDGNKNKIISGDVQFEKVIDKVKYITPVPGGVGKMTVVMLLKNVIKAWSVINNVSL